MPRGTECYHKRELPESEQAVDSAQVVEGKSGRKVGVRSGLGRRKKEIPQREKE